MTMTPFLIPNTDKIAYSYKDADGIASYIYGIDVMEYFTVDYSVNQLSEHIDNELLEELFIHGQV